MSSLPDPEFRNQYLITDAPSAELARARSTCIHLGPWNVLLFAPLRAASASRGNVAAVLIGVAVDPEHPERLLQDVLDDLLDQAHGDAESLFRHVARLTGRFVLATLAAGELLVGGDACHLRQILYGTLNGKRWIGSSEKLLLLMAGTALQMSASKQQFMRSPLFLRNEQAWVGAGGHDDRVSRLLPNHVLSYPTGRARRLPMRLPTQSGNESDAITMASRLLQGSFAALLPHHRLIQPVTAGLDSRLLLAASLPFKDQIEYYIFARQDNPGTQQDADVACVLAERLGLRFQVITPARVSPEFQQRLAAEHLFPRDLSKIENTQHHYLRADKDHVVNINGNGAEVCRAYYGREVRQPTFSRVCHYLGYAPEDAFVQQALEGWYTEARAFADQSGFHLSDLLYWEQRMGNWGAATPLEQDIAIEEFAPFNNKHLLSSLLTIQSHRRCGPDYGFFMQLLDHMSPVAASVPINPQTARYRKYIAGSATATYLGKLWKHRYVEWRARRA